MTFSKFKGLKTRPDFSEEFKLYLICEFYTTHKIKFDVEVSIYFYFLKREGQGLKGNFTSKLRWRITFNARVRYTLE